MFDLEFKRLGANKLVTICGADRYQNHNIGVQLRWKCIMCRLFPHVSYYRYSGQETNDRRHVSVKNCTCFFARIQALIWLRIKCPWIPHVQSVTMNSWLSHRYWKFSTKTVGKFGCAFQTATHVVRESSRQCILLIEFNGCGLTVTIFYFQYF
jgi:hypothetical protein